MTKLTDTTTKKLVPHKRILHLTLKKKWFDQIASGEKKEEYRDIKPYWESRFLGKEYDEIYFKNGYRKDSPFMRVEWLGCKKGWAPLAGLRMDTFPFAGPKSYIIKLGRILEVTR